MGDYKNKKNVTATELEKVLLEMSLEQEEEPFNLPNLPEFRSNLRNELSLVGRLLNPQFQKMSALIVEMPRKWQLYDRVQGVALSQDRFQFIFKHEHDLVAVLERGAYTFDSWSIVLERWTERPPPDYLQFLEIWVQMRNIPINHYTSRAIGALGEFAGQVLVVAFDPDKPQTRDYVRVKVKFDINKPLHRVKVVNLPDGGGSVKILYDYERLQKRCYSCQRLTHDQSHCPVERIKKQLQVAKSTSGVPPQSLLAELSIKEDDLLFGVVKEGQVGMDPMTGRPKIAKEVLDDMRQYLKVADGAERIARQDRLRKSLQDLENDPMGQKAYLRLEPFPLITHNIDKGKGIVLDFEEKDKRRRRDEANSGPKLLAGAIQAGMAMTLVSGFHTPQSASFALPAPDDFAGSSQFGSTGFSVGNFDTSTSGTKLRKTKPRRRPGTYKRRARKPQQDSERPENAKKNGKQVDGVEKRKATTDVETSQTSARFKKPLVVPSEGPSSI